MSKRISKSKGKVVKPFNPEGTGIESWIEVMYNSEWLAAKPKDRKTECGIRFVRR